MNFQQKLYDLVRYFFQSFTVIKNLIIYILFKLLGRVFLVLLILILYLVFFGLQSKHDLTFLDDINIQVLDFKDYSSSSEIFTYKEYCTNLISRGGFSYYKMNNELVKSIDKMLHLNWVKGDGNGNMIYIFDPVGLKVKSFLRENLTGLSFSSTKNIINFFPTGNFFDNLLDNFIRELVLDRFGSTLDLELPINKMMIVDFFTELGKLQLFCFKDNYSSILFLYFQILDVTDLVEQRDFYVCLTETLELNRITKLELERSLKLLSLKDEFESMIEEAKRQGCYFNNIEEAYKSKFLGELSKIKGVNIVESNFDNLINFEEIKNNWTGFDDFLFFLGILAIIHLLIHIFLSIISLKIDYILKKILDAIYIFLIVLIILLIISLKFIFLLYVICLF